MAMTGPDLDCPPRPHRGVFWLCVVLTLVLFAVIQLQQFALTQRVHTANCETTKFLKATDAYVVQHSQHLQDPKVAELRDFLRRQENRGC
jgi:hypothetical protein